MGKLEQKEKKDLDKKQGSRTAKEVEKEAKEKAQLEMLIGDTEAKSKAKQLEKEANDPRFDSIIAKDGKYATPPIRNIAKSLRAIIKCLRLSLGTRDASTEGVFN